MNYKDYRPSIVKIALKEIEESGCLSPLWGDIDFSEVIEANIKISGESYPTRYSASIAESFVNFIPLKFIEGFIDENWAFEKTAGGNSLVSGLLYSGKFDAALVVYQKYMDFLSTKNEKSARFDTRLFDGFADIGFIFNNNKELMELGELDSNVSIYSSFNRLISESAKISNVMYDFFTTGSQEKIKFKLENWNSDEYLKDSLNNFISKPYNILLASGDASIFEVFDYFLSISNSNILFADPKKLSAVGRGSYNSNRSNQEFSLFTNFLYKGKSGVFDYILSKNIPIPNKDYDGELFQKKLWDEMQKNIGQLYALSVDSKLDSYKDLRKEISSGLKNQFVMMDNLIKVQGNLLPKKKICIDLIAEDVLTASQKNKLKRWIPDIDDGFLHSNTYLCEKFGGEDALMTKKEWNHFTYICHDFDLNNYDVLKLNAGKESSLPNILGGVKINYEIPFKKEPECGLSPEQLGRVVNNFELFIRKMFSDISDVNKSFIERHKFEGSFKSADDVIKRMKI